MSDRDSQSLRSKIIKILRITTEPLSAHALSELYHLPYKSVQAELKELEEDKIVYSLRTKRGLFYFIPDKYLKRQHSKISSDEILPFLWYEELSKEELVSRKEKILESLTNLKLKFQSKEIEATDYFSLIQNKNEELAIITQILEDRQEKQMIRCFYCGTLLKKNRSECHKCSKEIPTCVVCKRPIVAQQIVVQCPNCNSLAHETHLKEWLKAIGNCPHCKKELLEKDLEYIKEEV